MKNLLIGLYILCLFWLVTTTTNAASLGTHAGRQALVIAVGETEAASSIGPIAARAAAQRIAAREAARRVGLAAKSY